MLSMLVCIAASFILMAEEWSVRVFGVSCFLLSLAILFQGTRAHIVFVFLCVLASFNALFAVVMLGFSYLVRCMQITPPQ
jgi:hypothetical protein